MNLNQQSHFKNLLSSIHTLWEEQTANLDKYFTIEEIEIAIKISKLKREPGPDGFSNVFLLSFRS